MKLTREQLTADVQLLEVREGDLFLVEVDDADQATEWADQLAIRNPFPGPVLLVGPGARIRVARDIGT